jgi:hypothetical protein
MRHGFATLYYAKWWQPGDPPCAKISSPANGAIFTEEEKIFFNGETSVGDSLKYRWSSNKGEVASGMKCNKSLEGGRYKIKLTVKDNLGRTSSQEISITVYSVVNLMEIEFGWRFTILFLIIICAISFVVVFVFIKRT